ncbi:MAG: response regulator, partial [Terriglobales bacterium]
DSASSDMSVVEFLSKVFEVDDLSGIHALVLSESEAIEQGVKQLGVSLQILRKPFKKAQLREALRQCQLSLRRTGDIVRPESQLKSFIASVDFATRSRNTTEEKKLSATRLLVVEDNPVNRRLVHLQLRTLGFECDIVENGQQAVEALADRQYDLVFMDCWMPVLDGFAATAKIREAETEVRTHTPIVAMTANAMDSDRDECIAAGMDDYISKPVTQSALRVILEKWITNRRAIQFDPHAEGQ